MAFTKKIAGWVAGRIKGEQARKDTMRWMEKTGLGQILDIAGDIALTQGALKGAGKLKGLFTGGPAAPAATTAAKALPEGVTEVGRLASASPAESRALVSQVAAPSAMKPLPTAGAATTTVAPRPMQAMVSPRTVPAQAPTPIPTGMTPQMTRTAAQMGGMQNVANASVTRGPGMVRSFLQGAKEYAPIIQATATPVANVIGQRMEMSLEEERMKREQEARNRLAMLLMPMFQAQMGQAAPSFQPRG